MKSIIETMHFVSFCLSLTRKGREGRKEKERLRELSRLAL